MANTRVRTLNFLPEIFQTPTNAEFLSATLDQLVNPPSTTRIQGYIGSRLGYGVDAKDYYVTEPTKTRTDYQLEPGVVFLKDNTEKAKDFITYPGMLDALKLEGAITNNNARLFNSEFYSWDSFTDLDKIINFNQYYWLPSGAPSVTVGSATVFQTNDYVVTDLPNGYDIKELGAQSGTINPTLTLLRGGTYQFIVDQDSQFWIQAQPGISGFSETQPNLPTREVFGVENNGATQGIVTFTVPNKDAQNDLEFPGNNSVDVVSSVKFEDINGQRLADVKDIDGITSLDGLRVMFYDTGDINEIGYISTFFDETNFDVNGFLVDPITLTLASCDALEFTLASGNTDSLVVGQTVTFDNPVFGGITGGQVYYVHSVNSSTTFSIATTLDATAPLTLIPDSGTMTVNVNQGLYEEGFYTTVSDNFYRIQYVGNPDDPVLRLIPDGLIPIEQKITARFGTEWISRDFYKNINGVISIIPLLTAPLDTLYYQDGTSSNKVGVIRLVDSNLNNTVDVEQDILGKKQFTSTNGVVFTNGLKVRFDGDVVPESYLEGEYYVEGVGTAIELIPVNSLLSPEGFTQSSFNPYDISPYDIGNYDANLFIPVEPDYITIARNAINKNAWSRSNRWFHIDVINATAQYNDDPSILTRFATGGAKAKRPIIEFYPNLKLFNSGTVGKPAVDFVDTRTTDALSLVAGKRNYYPDIEVYTDYTASIASATNATNTTVTINSVDISGTFQVGMYVKDSTNILPNNARITSINVNSGITVLAVEWTSITSFAGVSNASIVGSDTTVDNYAMFPGARIIFAADSDIDTRNKIFVANFSSITPSSIPVITLTVAEDGLCRVNDQVAVIRGYNNEGATFYFDGVEWKQGQQKVTVNQAPLFDVVDSNGISFGDADVYRGTSFAGCTLFAYGIGSGIDDPILGFPVRYSGVDNVGDLSFDVTLNSDTFDYTQGTNPITQNVNTGYVLNYDDRTTFTRELGWKTAVSPSTQYQAFSFDYTVDQPASFVCDVAMNSTSAGWPTIKVFVNNEWINPVDYTVSFDNKSTLVTLNKQPEIDTVVQILLLSDQVSKQAYYTIPVNLSNNPFNQDLTRANIGDIRAQYQDIFINAPDTSGDVFGPNNYRDSGNLIKYGTKIIQNSASLALPGTFLRKQNHNLFDALLFNSREYVKFKQLLVDTVNKIDFEQRYDPSEILDKALDEITASKNELQAFFWSDMLPSKAPLRSNTYVFNNDLDSAIYPLTKVYDFDKANYSGVLVYLSRTVNGNLVQRQLIKGSEYEVSADSPSLTVTINLLAGDTITVKEFNQTYGSYVPNTPTKLGLYPASEPTVVLDSDYTIPQYFIKGHDGSYTKLYGSYDADTDTLIDFRDQALLEFETRIYNNLKLGSTLPIELYDVVPGFFRNSDYSWNEFIEIYSSNFLNWVGQNRLDYKTQFFNKADEYTYNYSNSANKLDKTAIQQGYWRGLYEYFYDTTTPNETPWEMLGFKNQPEWWTERYGPAPYTSDNLILWEDLEAGFVWNNGDSYVIEALARPGLSKVLPVDSKGENISPFDSILGNYIPDTFQRDWQVGDMGPVEFSYRRSSSYPFDLMKIFAISKPAEFFNLCVDLDNYRYSEEFGQYLVDNRSHLRIEDIEVYGTGTPKTSYLNWIVDFEKQLGITATENITKLLDNLDVRLVYRLAGYSDKSYLKFYVEKGTPNSQTASLLLPDESYSVLLYDNQPFDRIAYSGVIVQQTKGGWQVYGNAQNFAFFRTLKPLNNGNYNNITIENLKVKVAKDYQSSETIVPYGTKFFSVQEVAQFLMSYGAWLKSKGMIFNEVENGVEITWQQMVSEFLYWTQTGWEDGSVITLNPAATVLKVDKDSNIVQPLTVQQTNFILNQNLYPIELKNLCVKREDTLFQVNSLNQGDSMAYAQFNMSNFEHGIVFDNTTVFNDTIYNLITGLRQSRIDVRGTKTAEWNGTVNASGFILNQDNIEEWSRELRYTKGQIVLYKNKYWTSLKVIQPSAVFNENDWKVIDYDDIQKGLLPNSSTRSYESTLYYDTSRANLERDADVLGFSLIGYRPRDYLAVADLSDVTQVNVYKNLIKNKGTRNAVEAFRGANLPQGGIDYEVYENWAIKSGDFGGVLNDNFVEFRLNESQLTGNPSIVSLTDGIPTAGSQQEVPLYSLFNYSRPVSSPDVLSTKSSLEPNNLYADAGYVNYDDVKMASYFFSGLPNAVNRDGIVVPIQDFYVGDYFWLANFKEHWNVYTWRSAGEVVRVRSNLNDTCTITFTEPHNLKKLDPLSIVNFSASIDGYYIVAEIVNLYEVIINLALANTSQSSFEGRGIGLTFESQRVKKPSDISQLKLLEAEFTKNTVWVDENSDGEWAVYRKSINFELLQELTRSQGQLFGSAVAYDGKLGYLISDPALGKAYRYGYKDSEFNQAQELTGATSFGTSIAYSNQIYAISEPASSGNGKVYIYTINNSVLSDAMIDYQVIDAPATVTGEWGSALALSDDTHWLYVSAKDDNKVYVYRQQNILLNSEFLIPGETYKIVEVGENTDWESAGAVEGKEGIYFVADSSVTGTGIAMQVSYKLANIIDGSSFLVSGDNFGSAIATDNTGDTVVISAPNKDFGVGIEDWGVVYAYQRTVQNIEVQFNSDTGTLQNFELAWTPNNLSFDVTDTNATGNIITLDDVTGIAENDPVIFTGIGLTGTDINANQIYYVGSIVGNTITIKESRSSNTPVSILTESSITSAEVWVQKSPLYVSVNGISVTDDHYAVVNDRLYYVGSLRAGDIINVSGNDFSLVQSFNSNLSDRTNFLFGYDLDVTTPGHELLVGSPFEINSEGAEGAVYRYTNGGAKYGVVFGVAECNLASASKLLINGFMVSLSPGNAQSVANQINANQITNIQAAATDDNKLVIQTIDSNVAQVCEKLCIAAYDSTTLSALGLQIFTETQVITSPHLEGSSQFGRTIKFNEFDSVVIASPSSTRFAGTTFDFTDDVNLDNDTIFDNNSTRFVDTAPNAGAVYMFDYVENYNENVSNPGKFVYAQSLNSKVLDYGNEPLYGTALEFIENQVIIGTPNYKPNTVGGEVTVYTNPTGLKDWSVFRQSAPIVDVNKVQNSQIFSAETNDTLINLDYIDPLQGKLLGAVRQNIDYVSNVDPAGYNSDPSFADQTGYVWGEDQVGKIWFNTNNVRWLNYHQNDVVYNAKYWGRVFPGSNVAVYTWVKSFTLPSNYRGQGTPLNNNLYSVSNTLNSSGVIVPVYYFWVRNTNQVNKHAGKTLADATIASYISNPKNSGVSYFAPVLPNTFALYNTFDYVNNRDSVLHIGYASGTTSDVSHQEFTLIRENFADDFLPGMPKLGANSEPEGLYDRLLDSLSGVDEMGQVVPNPYLPKAVQSGILARPRQSFFYDRYEALKNYLLYANEVLRQFPIAEIRNNVSFLFAKNEFYDTTDYWQYINWWADGYDNNTKSALQVPIYADLAKLTVEPNTLVTVEQNGDGKFEVYRYDGNGVWSRIGLENGTIEFKLFLWDYARGKTGYGDNFFDTSTYDQYPSEETRNIIRALNEQIYVDDLLIFRNRSLVLLFQYIQSETSESQNFLPWLNKTSLVDVAHIIRELRPIEVFKSDNQEFLEGYINEVKPYHVVVKEFLFKYTGEEVYEGNITDFDLPATYNAQTQRYISPQLVYGGSDSETQYSETSPIWGNPEYQNWFENTGVAIVGQPDYEITVLTSYLTLGSRFILVDNAQGFPINGVITIGEEQISYSFVDRSLNLIGGLIRGVNGTQIVDHIPGEKIVIDLPAVLVLDGGRGYTEPPRVTAWIDETKYPAPTRPAVLEAVMGLDSVLQVNVIDPGQGYAVLPEIRIDSASQIFFKNTDVNSSLHTIKLPSSNIATGDLIQYRSSEQGKDIGRLVNRQWYYVNVLESSPSIIVALYTSFGDAVNDRNRVAIYNDGNGSTFSLNVGAKASAITSASPVRENNITLRFDRTTYTSQVKDWKAGAYYGSFFAGSYFNSENVSSSSIGLESTQPPINDILASAQGAAFEITDVRNDRELTWSSYIRYVESTETTDNSIRLILQDGDGSGNPNASGSTIGFYVGMPIKFLGAVSGGLIENQNYYVKEVINDTDFTVSLTPNGSVVSLTDSTISAQGLRCLVGNVIDTAILTVNYPGILEVTNTEANTNKLTVPMSLVGTGGTKGFYMGLPVFFTGDVFGNVVENLNYYITTVVDNETFTMSTSDEFITTNASQTISSSDTVKVTSTSEFAVNDPIIFNTMTVSGSPTTNFGNIVSGETYYVHSIVSETELKISTRINGGVFALSDVTGTALLTNQKNTVTLSTAEGSMTMNVSLPVSPGQVDGQLFTLYGTSEQFPGITSGTVNNLITRSINATIDTVNRIALSVTEQGTDNFYVNMPIRVDQSLGNLVAGTTYYVIEYSGMPDPLQPGQVIPNIQVSVSSTSSSTNELTCDSTESLYLDMPIIFSGVALGGLAVDQEYFIDSITSSTTFTVKASITGSTLTLTTSNGVMIGTGDPYIKISESVGGSEKILTDNILDFNLTQYVTDSPEFDLSYVLGGYRAVITDAGTGFAVNNTITISGTEVGGTTPANDITLTINSIDETTGGITDVICSGRVPEIPKQYYLKVISPNELAVYSNSLMSVPVSGIDFEYTGITSTTVTYIDSNDNTITVDDASEFVVNDAVVFTGDVSPAIGSIVAGQTYYITSIVGNAIKFSSTPGGTVISIPTEIAVDFSMAKLGSIALLPEPFFFNQSVVRFNGRVYICIISNNDDEFIFGKWELLESGDRRLNALDRTIGYYQPTANMPGVDLTQLFNGVTYPNPTYLGNPFAPADQYELDTILKPQPFYPSQVDMTSVLWDGSNYLAAANLPEYSAVIGSNTGENWAIAKIANVNVNTTDIIYANGLYVMTSSNSATPIYRSNDGIVWTTNGYFTPFSANPYDTLPYDTTSISVASLALNSVAFGNGYWVAVGKNIVRSSDTYTWSETQAFSPELNVELFGVSYVELPAFTGFIAVGKGKRFDYTTGVTQLVDTSVILYSETGEFWTQVESITPKSFNSVSSDGNVIVAVGDTGIVYYSNNGSDWLGVNEVQVLSINTDTNQINVTNTAGFQVNDTVKFSASVGGLSTSTTYYVIDVVSETQIQVSDSLGGSAVTLVNSAIPEQTMMFSYDTSDSALRDVIYADSTWIAVGDSGEIKTSSDYLTWTSQSSGVSEDLNGIIYNSTDDAFITVGDNNTILLSEDSGATWNLSSVFTVAPSVYDVKGADFDFGYGPEELVPAIVTDNLLMTVTTRPGTNWPVVEYSHAGYNVVSTEIEPESETQVEYSFDNLVEYPAQLSVQVIDAVTGLGTTLSTTEYTVDWLNKSITLDQPLVFTPASQKLRIDVYEVGNGDQLVKSSTSVDPIRLQPISRFNEIYLSCNYSDNIFNGSGVIRPGSHNIEVVATATDDVTNRITCESVSDFTVNDPITFQGATFGGILENVTYYVKTVSVVTNTITVSASYNTVTGTAGPTLELTTATGSMTVNIQTGAGTVWSDPIVYRNGQKLVLGKTNTVTRTRAINNAVVTNSTGGLVEGTPIVFCDCAFQESGIVPLQVYYIATIINGTEFTISETLNGPIKELNNATGGTRFITNDYAFGIQPDGIRAKMMFPTDTLSNDTDYIVYSVFGETAPAQYGYAIPETEEFIGNGSQSVFFLDNFISVDSARNAIVEIDGLRITNSQYTIDTNADTITFVSPPSLNSVVAVTTFNDTERQYLNTQFGITGTPGSAFVSLTVTATNNTTGTFDQDTPVAQTFDQDTPTVVTYDENLNWLTVSDTSDLNVNDTIILSGTEFGGLIAGRTYYVIEILSGTEIVISEQVGGTPVELTNDTGTMTANANGLTVASIVNISNTITAPIATTRADETFAATDEISVLSVAGFVVDQPVVFKGTSFGDIATDGTVYFIESIDTVNDTFTIKDQFGTTVSLSDGTGNILVEVGGQPAIRVTTGVDHNFVENTLIRIDGTSGSVQLNGNTYYAKVITDRIFDLYNQPYDSSIGAINDPVTTISSYVGGGYTWRAGTFYISNTTAVSSNASNNYITVGSTTDLVVGTPVLFTASGAVDGDDILGGIEQGTIYYVKSVIDSTNFTISSERYGETFSLTNDTGIVNVSQWEQVNVDRLWVTVNGYRVPSSKLRISANNEVSILTEIVPGDEVIMTSMINYATPNQERYLNIIDKNGDAVVYKASASTTTWLHDSIYDLTTEIKVDDVRKVTNLITQEVTTPTAIDGHYYIGLTADKRIISGVEVVNNTTGETIADSNYEVVIQDASPVLKIKSGVYITSGDNLTINTLEGNTILVNGEQIRFSTVNFETNTLSGLQRGVNGTAKQVVIPKYSEVFGLLSSNELAPVFYNQVWNSYVFNTVEGDPLQISETVPAEFLQVDNM